MRILSREGAAHWVSSFFFKSVIQAVLIFGVDTWVVTPRIGKELGGFQTQMARRLMVRILWRTHGKCIYNSTAAAMEEAGFLKM